MESNSLYNNSISTMSNFLISKDIDEYDHIVDIDKYIDDDNKSDYIIESFVDKLKNYNIYDLSKIISILTSLLTKHNTINSNNLEDIYSNNEYLNNKKQYEFNLIKVKSIDYLNNCKYIKRYIPTEFSDYLNFDDTINNYINFLYNYYYNKDSVNDYYDKIDYYFNSLFSILEINIDLLNHNDIKCQIKKEYDILTDKILNLLTNINILVNNKF